MRRTLFWIAFLYAAAGFASPTDDFKAALARPSVQKIPPLVITWDQGSHEAEVLKERDPARFKEMKTKKADEHERLIAYLMPGAGIRYNTQGRRDDSTGIKKITLTPLRWVSAVADDGNPWHLHLARWAAIENCQVAEDTKTAFAALVEACEIYKDSAASAAEKNLRRDALLAKQAFDDCLALKASIDQRRFLARFLKATAF